MENNTGGGAQQLWLGEEIWEEQGGQQQQEQPVVIDRNFFEIDADYEEECEEEKDEDDNNNRDTPDGGTPMDGGVAINPEEAYERAERSSRECDLILYFYCEEEIDAAQQQGHHHYHHPVARPGVVVSIGLDKHTRMAAVFNRYVDFCNETKEKKKGEDEERELLLSVEDLEFVHCELLSGSETADANALMKNDRILVRKNRTKERLADEFQKHLQRVADRDFFLQLRKMMLLDSEGSKTSDIVVLDCRGKVIDESGINQQMLQTTTVRAHYVIVKKRCPWLGEIIDQARREGAKQHRTEHENATTNEDLEKNDKKQELRRVGSDGKSSEYLEEDDGILLSFQPKEKRDDTSMAAEIENGNEEEIPFDEPRKIEDHPRPHSPVMSSFQQTSASRELLVVQIPDHSLEAVKLLLEYCYSNRVYALGHEAFVQACKSRPHNHQGPVPPYYETESKRWPNYGLPTVSLFVALAGVSLAEEARMPRLSLMCEVAASQLLCTTNNVVEALSMCTYQKSLSGNGLPRLRKAAMDIVLGCESSSRRDVIELGGEIPTGSFLVMKAWREGMQENTNWMLLRSDFWKYAQHGLYVQYLINANLGGRCALEKNLNPALWPLIFERADRTTYYYYCPLLQNAKADAIYHLFRNEPILWKKR